MIPRPSTGESFHRLAAYLVNPKAGVPAEDRLVHAEAFNLGVYSDLSDGQSLTAEQIKSIAFMMTDTASLSTRVEKPSYQFSVSFAPGDKPTIDQMRESAKGYIDALGLTDHEWYFVKQDDRSDRYKGEGEGYDHYHVSVNRVLPMIDPKDPEKLTGRAKNMGQDWPVLERESRRQEKEFGFRVVPGPNTGLEPDKQGIYHSPTRVELEKSVRTGDNLMFRMRVDKCREVRKEIEPVFEASSGWPGFQRRLRSHGYKLEPVGKKGGLRVVRGMMYAKFSDLVPPKLRVKDLIKQWGPFEFEKAEESVARPKPPQPQQPPPKRDDPTLKEPKKKADEEDDGFTGRKPGQSRKAWLEEQQRKNLLRKRETPKPNKEKDDDEPDMEL